jgi:hypothetical protein
MSIFNLFDVINWQAIFFIFTVVFGFGVALFHRCSYFVYDTGWITIVALSIAVALVEYLYLIEGQGLFSHALYVAIAFLLFLFGARASRYLSIRAKYSCKGGPYYSVVNRPLQIKKLMQLMKILQLIIIFMLIARGMTQGFPIFADDPEIAKVQVNSEGFGLITRLMEPSLIMATSIAMLLITSKVISIKKFLSMLVPVIIALLATGSKGAFVILLGAYVIALVYLKGSVSSFKAPKIAINLSIFTLFIISYSFLVLYISGAAADDPLSLALYTFGVRLLAFGDAVFYFFFNDLFDVISLQPIDYLWDFFISPLLSISRLIDYPITLGLRISGELFGMKSGGPNPTLFVEGYVYFGYAFGLLYAFLIGMAFQYLRSNIFNSSVWSSAWGYLFFTLLFSLSSALPTDMILFVGGLINSAIVLFLLWILHQGLHFIAFNLRRTPL